MSMRQVFKEVRRGEHRYTHKPTVTVEATFTIQKTLWAELWDDPEQESMCERVLNVEARGALLYEVDQLSSQVEGEPRNTPSS